MHKEPRTTFIAVLNQPSPGEGTQTCEHPEQGHEGDQRAGTPLLQRQTEAAGLFQLREQKAPGKSPCSLLVFKGNL